MIGKVRKSQEESVKEQEQGWAFQVKATAEPKAQSGESTHCLRGTIGSLLQERKELPEM